MAPALTSHHLSPGDPVDSAEGIQFPLDAPLPAGAAVGQLPGPLLGPLLVESYRVLGVSEEGHLQLTVQHLQQI